MRPFGYADDRHTIVPAEADAIREAAHRILAGGSLRATASWLNDSGLRTSTGGRWHPNTVRRVLTSPRVAGVVMVGEDGAYDEADWPHILELEEWEKLTRILTDPARRSATGGRTRVYLLTGGIARCGRCNAPLVPRPDRSGARGYVCRSGPPTEGCGRIRIHGDALEDHVGLLALARLADPATRQRLLNLGSSAAAAVAEEIESLNRRRRELGEDYADGKLDRFTFAETTKKLTQRIEAARVRGQRADEVYLLAPLTTPRALSEWWNDATPNERRRLLTLVLDWVEIQPVRIRGARVFDSGRVLPHWHQDEDHRP